MGSSIRAKLLTLVALAFLITVIGVIGLTLFLSGDISREVAKVVDQGQTEVYSQRLNGITVEIEQGHRGLQAAVNDSGLAGTDMAKTYETEAQAKLIESITKQFYAGREVKETDIYPFIVDAAGTVVLHPRLAKGDGSLKQAGFADRVNGAKGNLFSYGEANQVKWVFFKKFDPWGWTVCYAVPDSVKYAGVAKVKSLLNGLSTKLAVVIIVLAIGVLAALAWFVSRFITGPLGEVIQGLTEASGQVTSASRQVSENSEQISEMAHEQAASLEEISSSLQELNSMTKLNADNAGKADNLAQQAFRGAEEGDGAMKEMQTAMMAIKESSDKISKIIGMIEEIAFQTNLLALNASVEAARAGEHGKGFAVVADEVRNLAIRSSNQAKDSVTLIQDSVGKTKSGTETADRSKEALIKIMEHSKRVAELITSIANVSNDQATGIGQVTSAVDQISRATQNASSSAEQSAAFSHTLKSQAEVLEEMIGKLRSLAGGMEKQGAQAPDSRFQAVTEHALVPVSFRN